MTDPAFRSTLYMKQNCPFCLKVRIALLETGQQEAFAIRDFVPGTPEEEAIRAELSPQVAKVTFPTAQIAPDRYIAESDDIVALIAQQANTDTARLALYRNYVDGPLSSMMTLWRENQELKAKHA